MSLEGKIIAQFRHPRGAAGALAGWIMAHRSSNRRRSNWTIELLDVRAGDHVLEVGCGPGRALATALKRSGDGGVLGIDHSKVMIAQAARYNRAAIAQGRLTLRQGSFEVLGAWEQAFDKVFSVNVVQFLADKKGAFRALMAALKPSGAIATTYQPRHRRATREHALDMADTIRRAMLGAGFTEIRGEELPLAGVPAVCVLGRKPAGSPAAITRPSASA